MKMRDIELEEGEAYSLQDDDDENIDPDRDFSYLDKKIEIVLGQDQRDFLAGLTPENLGARYGGYGSFLPMQQRSPPVLSNPTAQSQCNTKSPQNPPPDRSHQNPSAVAHHSLPGRPGLPSKGLNDRSMQAPSEPGVSLTNKQPKLQSLEDGCFNDQQKKPLIHHPDQSLLKFRVKMTSENVSSRDNSAIYSGLGLDMSPSSSPDDSPAECDGTSPGMQESKEESPSTIIKIMISCPLFNDVLLSPLDDRLISFMQMENDSGPGELGFTQQLPVDSIDGSTYSETKRKTKEGRKSKLDNANKDEKPKHKESRKDKKLKQKVQSMMASDSVKANQEYPVTAVGLPPNKSEAGKISVAKVVVSKISNDVADGATMTSNSSCFRPDKKNEIGQLEEVNDRSMKQDRAPKARDKSTGESVSVPSHDVGMGGEGNGHSSRGKTDKDKNVISHPMKDPNDRRNDVVRREAETNKSVKQQIVAKERAKELVLNSLFLKEDDNVHRKEKIPKAAEVGFISTKDVEGNDKHFVSQDEEDDNVETIEPLKKSFSKPMPNPQMGPGIPSGKEHSSAAAKKKSKESQADGVSVSTPGGNFLPFRTKKGDMDLHKEVRKDVNSATNAYPGKKAKDGSSQDSMMGISEREMHASGTKMKDKSTGKKIGIGLDIGPNAEGDLAGKTKAPAENALSIVMDDWVMCEKCEKWRLLPFGRNPDLLPKKWICKMLDWLPGMNKCSFTEEETTNALYAMYQLQVPASLVQSNQQGHTDGSRPVGQPPSLPTRAADTGAIPGGGNKMDSVRTQINATRQGSFPGYDIPVKKEQHLSEHRIPKNLKKHPRESDVAAMNGDSKSSKSAKKRMAEFEASGTPKKMKRQSLEKPDPVGMLPIHVKVEGQSYNPGALQLPDDFAKGVSGSPLMKAKGNTQHAVVARVNEKQDVSGKKRKMNDQLSDVPTEEVSAKGTAPKKGTTEHRKEKKEKKSKIPNTQPREGSIDKGKGKTHGDAGIYNIGDNKLPNGSRMNDAPLGKHHAESASQRNNDGRKSSEKAHDLGLDNATTSSSSKISYKVKAKGRGTISSPVGSISSSPMKASKPDRDNHVKKGTSVSHEESEELVASKWPKVKAEGSSNELVAHNEEMRVRKSNLSRSSRVKVDASDDDPSTKKVSSSKRPSVHGIDTHVKPENHACGKLDMSYEEGTSTSLQNFVSENQGVRSLDRLYFDETSSKSRKPHASSDASIKKEPSSHTHGFPRFDEGGGLSAKRADKVSLRHPDPTGLVSRDVGASSSIADSFYKAAKTALQEATDLKLSANNLKKSGSGLESTRLFFQAALKFLRGASLLEPDNSESGRCGEMSPSDVYGTTAKLCEYCAREYERSNDMASAALAYKCMEVAYMRVVYYNDLAASRDRMALHMVVRAAPQADSPSSSASDIDNLNNQVAMDAEKNGHSSEHRNHVISAGNRPNFMRLLDFTKDINLAMEASRRAQSAFVAAIPVLRQAGNEEPLSCIKRVLDFSFHDVDALLHLVRLAMGALNNLFDLQ